MKRSQTEARLKKMAAAKVDMMLGMYKWPDGLSPVLPDGTPRVSHRELLRLADGRQGRVDFPGQIGMVFLELLQRFPPRLGIPLKLESVTASQKAGEQSPLRWFCAPIDKGTVVLRLEGLGNGVRISPW